MSNSWSIKPMNSVQVQETLPINKDSGTTFNTGAANTSWILALFCWRNACRLGDLAFGTEWHMKQVLFTTVVIFTPCCVIKQTASCSSMSELDFKLGVIRPVVGTLCF